MKEGPLSAASEETAAHVTQNFLLRASAVVLLALGALLAKKGCDAFTPRPQASAAEHPEEHGAVDFFSLSDDAVLTDMHDADAVPIAFKIPAEEKGARPIVVTFLPGTKDTGPIIRIGGRRFLVQNRDMFGGRLSLHVSRVTRAHEQAMGFTSETDWLRGMQADIFLKDFAKAAASLSPEPGEHIVTLPCIIHTSTRDLTTTVTLFLHEKEDELVPH